MCFTYTLLHQCPYCYKLVKDFEPETKEQRCIPRAKCPYRTRSPLPHCLREEISKTECADCAWDKARRLLASRTTEARLRVTKLSVPVRPTMQTQNSVLGDPFQSRWLLCGLHDDIHWRYNILDRDSDFEERGKFYLGSGLMKEIIEWKEPFTSNLAESASAPSLSFTLASQSTQSPDASSNPASSLLHTSSSTRHENLSPKVGIGMAAVQAERFKPTQILTRSPKKSLDSRRKNESLHNIPVAPLAKPGQELYDPLDFTNCRENRHYYVREQAYTPLRDISARYAAKSSGNEQPREAFQLNRAFDDGFDGSGEVQ